MSNVVPQYNRFLLVRSVHSLRMKHKKE